MASIQRVELKAVKQGFGHDGGGLSANIYYKNKKIGSVSDDGWGGPMLVTVEKEKETFEKIANAYKKETKENLLDAEEHLIYSLLHLKDFEKTFKSALKENFTSILYLDYHPRDENGRRNLKAPVPYPSEEMYYCSTEQQISEILEEKKPVKHEVYRSLEDFVK